MKLRLTSPLPPLLSPPEKKTTKTEDWKQIVIFRIDSKIT